MLIRTNRALGPCCQFSASRELLTTVVLKIKALVVFTDVFGSRDMMQSTTVTDSVLPEPPMVDLDGNDALTQPVSVDSVPENNHTPEQLRDVPPIFQEGSMIFESEPSSVDLPVDKQNDLDALSYDMASKNVDHLPLNHSSELMVDTDENFGDSATSTNIHEIDKHDDILKDENVFCDQDQSLEICASTDAVVSTSSNADLDAVEPLSAASLNIDDDEFGDFGAAEVVTSPSNLAHPEENDEHIPTENLAPTQADSDKVGILDAVEPFSQASSQENQMYSDELADAPQSALESVSTLLLETKVDNDMLGDFDSTVHVSSPPVIGDDGFGDFAAVEQLPTTNKIDSQIDDDDFGDFGEAAEQFSPTGISDPPVDDDDDFGDFDEAPIAMPMKSAENTFSMYSGNEHLEKDAFVSSSGDPVLTRIYSSFANLFPVLKEESSIVQDDGVDVPIPLFTESDFISIESCMVRNASPCWL